jgi:serine/threonine-protein kinase
MILSHMSTEPPKLVGKYEILARIARGGMAGIFLARQPGIGGFSRRVVLKTILPSLAEDPKFVQMFMEEARLASMIHNPNVVQIFDVGKDDDTYFIAMELVDGLTVGAMLSDLCGGVRSMPAPVAGEIVAQACAGLHAAHKLLGEDGTPLGIVHRDISPQNLMVSRDGVVKLVDFGIAKAHDSAVRTGTGKVKGKFAYMSPEQVRAGDLDRRSDLFSLAAVFLELLTGKRLFQRDNELATLQAILQEPIPPVRDLAPGVPAPLADVIARALRRERDERYDTAAEMGGEVRRALGGLGHYTSADTLAAYVEVDCAEHLRARKIARFDQRAKASDRSSTPGFVDLASSGFGGMDRGAAACGDVDSAPGEDTRSDSYILGTVEAQLAEAAQALHQGVDPAWAITASDGPASAPAPPSPESTPRLATRGVVSSRPPRVVDAPPREPSRGASARPAEPPLRHPAAPTAAERRAERRPVRDEPDAGRLRRRLAAGVFLGALAGVALAFALGYRPRVAAPALPPIAWANPPSLPAPELERGLGPVAAHLSRAAGREIRVVRSATYGDTVARLLAGEVALATLTPALFVEARRQAPDIPVLAAFGGADEEGERSYIVARDDSSIRSADQLEGTRFCAADPRSAASYLVPRHYLRSRGLSPAALFATTTFSDGHVGVLEDVIAGRCDVGAVSASVWLGARRLGVRAERLRLVADAGDVPPDLLCATPRLDPDLADTLRRALLDFDAERHAGPDPPSPVAAVERFSEPSAEGWAAIEAAMRAEAGERPPAPPR